MGCILETPSLYGGPAQPVEELTPHFLRHLLLLTLSPQPQVSRNLLCQLSGPNSRFILLISLLPAPKFSCLIPYEIFKNEWVNLFKLLE